MRVWLYYRLSRLGRHKTQTALFIDYLRQQGIAVLSVTENLNTMLDEDDLIIGVRGLVNDYYAKDIGNKIRHGYREKQKVGLVITPPFGYWKDRNTNRIHQHPETAETVHLIYDYYLQGVGQKEIARRLNRLGRKTPAQLRAERYGKEFYTSRKNQSGQYVWTYVSVKNILMEEGYTGVLINHRTETCNGKAKPVPAEHWQRHEVCIVSNFFFVTIRYKRKELIVYNKIICIHLFVSFLLLINAFYDRIPSSIKIYHKTA